MSTTLSPVEQRQKTVRSLILGQRAQLEAALPRHLTPERMLRTFFSELHRTPALWEATPISMLGALIQAGQLGLEFGGVLGHAYLVPFRNRRRGGAREVQLIPGYKGLLKLARNTGELSSVSVHTVHVGDEFRYEYGLDPLLVHKPTSELTVKRTDGRTEVIWPISHFYAAARLRDGAAQFEVMTLLQVQAHRDRYAADKGEGGAWTTHFQEMGEKTVLRRLCRLLPASTELERSLVLEGQARHQEPQDLGVLVPDAEKLGAAFALDTEGLGAEERAPTPEDGELVRSIRTAIVAAEAALPEGDRSKLRRQHLGGADLGAVSDPAALQDYLDALGRVPR
jgi:recombination protein RecT